MDSFKRKKEEQCSIISKSPDEYWREIRAVQAMHDVVEYLDRAVANHFYPCPSAGRCLIHCATHFRH
jgi:hypothetical protein